MKIVILPLDLRWSEDRLYPNKWIRLKDIETVLESRDDESIIKLVSDEQDLIEADWIIFIGWYAWSFKWYSLVLKNKLLDKTVYWMLEPEVVNPQHSKSGIFKFLKRFKYVMTWNRKLIDYNRVFWLNIPYNWKMDIDSKVFDNIFDEKILLTNITANKTSLVEGELYSERERAIKWFNDNHSDEFIFYGNGWSKNEYKTYGGVCGDKKEIYQKFKFALCIENASIVDCLSEKIMDCLISGVVPIYKGAPNITEYIPANCFIDYDKFSCFEDLYNYLKNMSEYEYRQYINSIRQFVLNTDEIEIFSAKKWIECFDYLNFKNKKTARFDIKQGEKLKYIFEHFIFNIKYLVYKIWIEKC